MAGINIDMTIGHVASIIAAGIVVANIFCPAAIAYILAGFLKDTESASTWTVAGSQLQASLWPLILQTDRAQDGGNVRTSVSITSKILPLFILASAIAGVVTPLGLGEEYTQLAKVDGQFEYIKDEGPYGTAMSQRNISSFTRTCLSYLPYDTSILAAAACPYTDDVVVYGFDELGYTIDAPDGLRSGVPEELVEMFSSGAKDENSTISNFFDIEWRRLSGRAEEMVDNGSSYSVGSYRQLDSFILDGNYKVLEGLIVDVKDGGIGFRNHTLPSNLERGAEWDEDLLFLEPVTSCVNTNLTLDYKIHETVSLGRPSFADLRLTDRGGFHNLNRTYPSHDYNDSQSDPELLLRAYRAAWLNNVNTMLYLNVTNPNDPENDLKAFSYLHSEPDKKFPMPNDIEPAGGYRALDLSHEFADYLGIGQRTNVSQIRNILNEDGTSWANPWNITSTHLNRINVACSGAGRLDVANMSNIYVGCGLLRGTPQRVGEGPQAVFDSGSSWTSPLHSCAATVRATIKTVTFSFNGTTSLDNLQVRQILPKEYGSEEELPLWGLEASGFPLGGFSAIWGLISPAYESHENVSTRRSRYFYLPGYSGQGSSIVGNEANLPYNLPAAHVAQSVMNTVLDLDSWPFDLKGTGSMSIFRRWQKLSADPAKAAHIINLMWTDIAASAVVGTKGVLGEHNRGSSPAQITVRPIGKRITYKIIFGIPAFILLFLWATVVLVAILTTCFGQASFGRLRRRLVQLSVGRVFTTFMWPKSSTLTMSVRQWRDVNGDREVMLGEYAKAGDESVVLEERGGHGRRLSEDTGEDVRYLFPFPKPGLSVRTSAVSSRTRRF